MMHSKDFFLLLSFNANKIQHRVSGNKLPDTSGGEPLPFHAVSVFTPLLSAFCRYVIMVLKGWSQTFRRAQRGNKADMRPGSTAASRERDRHSGTVILLK